MSFNKHIILAVFATLIVHQLVASTDEVIEERNCTKPITINISETGSGSFKINVEENCDIFMYQIKCWDNSSIVKIKSTFTDYSNITNLQDPRKIQVIFKEFTTLIEGSKSLVVVNQYDINSQVISTTYDKIFFSRTSDLTVNVIITGNWSQSDFDLKLSYEEVEFKEFRESSKVREGKISPWISAEGRGYRPNSVYIFQILKSEDLNASNIDIELIKVQIDGGIGEYLLVGSGKDVFQGPPPLFISSSQSKKRIKIFDENAYIVLVSTSTRFNYSGFDITWRYNGTKIDVKEDKIDEDRIRKITEESSMPICIFNSSAALRELNKEDSFIRFREKLASLATEYYPLFNDGKKLNIDSSQVRIVRVSGFVKEDGLYVMVNIQHKDGRAVFDWKKMGSILQIYSSVSNSTIMDGYSVKECPKKTIPQSRWPFYLIAPIICCLCLLIWNWNHTPFSRIFSKKVKVALLKSRNAHVIEIEENEYTSNPEVNAVPKVLITNDQGRRYTWTHDADILSSGAEQDSDVEVFNQMELKRSNSSGSYLKESKKVFNEMELKRSNSSRSYLKESGSARSSTRQIKPEINMAFELEEEYKDEIKDTPEASTSTNENFYDSINSQKSLLTRFVTAETKL